MTVAENAHHVDTRSICVIRTAVDQRFNWRRAWRGSLGDSWASSAFSIKANTWYGGVRWEFSRAASSVADPRSLPSSPLFCVNGIHYRWSDGLLRYLTRRVVELTSQSDEMWHRSCQDFCNSRLAAGSLEITRTERRRRPGPRTRVDGACNVQWISCRIAWEECTRVESPCAIVRRCLRDPRFSRLGTELRLVTDRRTDTRCQRIPH